MEVLICNLPIEGEGHAPDTVTCYGEEIFWLIERIEGIRTYRFCLTLIDKIHEWSLFKRLDFVFTCDLSKFQAENKLVSLKRLDIDWKALIDKAMPGEWEYREERLKRKSSTVIPERVANKNRYLPNYEFLEFTQKTADSWGGPFEQDGKLGAAMMFGQNEFEDEEDRHFPVYNVEEMFHFYDLPRPVQQRLDSEHQVMYQDRMCGNGANWIYGLTNSERKELFNSLSIGERYETAVSYHKNVNLDLKQSLMRRLPFEIYICGTDDCSYTKWFATEEEMNEEVAYLRKMQPLDFVIDIVKRGYVFTN